MGYHKTISGSTYTYPVTNLGTNQHKTYWRNYLSVGFAYRRLCNSIRPRQRIAHNSSRAYTQQSSVWLLVTSNRLFLSRLSVERLALVKPQLRRIQFILWVYIRPPHTVSRGIAVSQGVDSSLSLFCPCFLFFVSMLDPSRSRASKC